MGNAAISSLQRSVAKRLSIQTVKFKTAVSKRQRTGKTICGIISIKVEVVIRRINGNNSRPGKMAFKSHIRRILNTKLAGTVNGVSGSRAIKFVVTQPQCNVVEGKNRIIRQRNMLHAVNGISTG